jgi:hypothetical protein
VRNCYEILYGNGAVYYSKRSEIVGRGRDHHALVHERRDGCPDQYTAWLSSGSPLTTAGPNERAQFMDPPVSEPDASTNAAESPSAWAVSTSAEASGVIIPGRNEAHACG